MKVLLIGSHGMLGQELVQVFIDQDLVAWDTEEIDITNKDQVLRKIKALKPQVIINAAAYTAVDDCEEKQELALAVNGEGPGYLAEIAKEIQAKLIHYSTDYIFSGEKDDGYDEEFNEIDPVNVYGESKAVGEAKIKASGCEYYIIRTAWLYGSGGNNFVDTMIKLGIDKDELKIVNDQHGCPTYAVDLAMTTKKMVDEKKATGIYHVTNSGHCTWCEFAQEIFKLKNILVKVIPCASAEFPRPAKRPKYSILLNTKLAKIRPWQEALKEYLEK